MKTDDALELKLVENILEQLKGEQPVDPENVCMNVFWRTVFFFVYAPFAYVNFSSNCLNIVQFLQLINVNV